MRPNGTHVFFIALYISPPGPGLFHRVLGFILCDLFVHDLIQVHAAYVRHQNAIAEDVCKLLPDLVPLFFTAKVGAAPLEYLQQLGGLQREGDGQVLGGMELEPVPVVPEPQHPGNGLVFEHGDLLPYARTAQRSFVERAPGVLEALLSGWADHVFRNFRKDPLTGILPESLFYQPVLPGVEGEDGSPAAGLHDARELVEKAVQHFEFTVDVDAQGLERPLAGFFHGFGRSAGGRKERAPSMTAASCRVVSMEMPLRKVCVMALAMRWA